MSPQVHPFLLAVSLVQSSSHDYWNMTQRIGDRRKNQYVLDRRSVYVGGGLV
jgi:hypothetical protein